MKKHEFLSNFFVMFKSFINKNTIIFIVISCSLLLSSCARIRSVSLPVPTDLLINKGRLSSPIVENAVNITVTDNPQVQSVYKLKESIKSALKTSLDGSNIFGHDSSKPFEIVVKVLEFHQPGADFGMFDSTLKTHYVIFDEDKKLFFEEDVVTDASSDIWYFEGAQRAHRAATVTVAKNVSQFVDILKNRFGASSGKLIKKKISESNAHSSAILGQLAIKLAKAIKQERWKDAKDIQSLIREMRPPESMAVQTVHGSQKQSGVEGEKCERAKQDYRKALAAYNSAKGDRESGRGGEALGALGSLSQTSGAGLAAVFAGASRNEANDAQSDMNNALRLMLNAKARMAIDCGN